MIRGVAGMTEFGAFAINNYIDFKRESEQRKAEIEMMKNKQKQEQSRRLFVIVMIFLLVIGYFWYFK